MPDLHRVTTSDGWSLELERLPAAGRPWATALLLPAMMVDRRTLERPPGFGFASALAAEGLEVFLADLRGRGGSGPTVEAGGRWTYDDLVRRDLPALVEGVRSLAPGRFLWVVGHSLGGHVAAAAAAEGAHARPPDGHVLLAANVWMPSLEPSPLRRLEKHLAILAFEAASRKAGCFPSRRLGLGPVDEAGGYVADLARFWHQDRWASRDGVDWLAALPRVSGPLLGVLGRGDRLMGHPAGARAWAGRFGAGRAEVHLAGRGRLGLRIDPGHMGLVTDPRSRPLWRWVARRMRALTGS